MKIFTYILVLMSQLLLAQPIQIAQMVSVKQGYHQYSHALPTLFKTLNEKTSLKIDPQVVVIEEFSEEIFKYSMIYVNYADRKDWNLAPEEQQHLRNYLELGGFLYIDAGVNASFLDEKTNQGQHHSFANWQVSKTLEEQFKAVIPESQFNPLPRSHALFSIFNAGLPDHSKLPETVHDFVVNEKWPDGTYSLVGLKVKGRIAVLASPILAMGWGKNTRGRWESTISFRVRAKGEGLSEMLANTSYLGDKYEVINEAGQTEFIYCQKESKPSWIEESDGTWRIFRYYQGEEISDFAHQFYTRLGMNIFLYALLN